MDLNHARLPIPPYPHKMVRSPGLEPGRSPMRPSNARVCRFRHDRKKSIQPFRLNCLSSITRFSIFVKEIFQCPRSFFASRLDFRIPIGWHMWTYFFSIRFSFWFSAITWGSVTLSAWESSNLSNGIPTIILARGS